jgi:hypothetical protein
MGYTEHITTRATSYATHATLTQFPEAPSPVFMATARQHETMPLIP